jgi:hypothetical protein
LHKGDDFKRSVFVEDDNSVYEMERQEYFASLFDSIDRSIRALVRTYRSIRVETNDQGISELPCLPQIAYVSWMQKVEYAVGEHDNPATALHLPGKCCGLFAGRYSGTTRSHWRRRLEGSCHHKARSRAAGQALVRALEAT